MAILNRENDSWLTWAIELMKRGLKPNDDEITVHGPHEGADYMWGEAECDTLEGGCYNVKFRTAHTNSKWDVRGVRVWSKHYNEPFPILKTKEIPPSWRQEIKSLKAELRKRKKD